MNTRELLEYNIDEILFTSFLCGNHELNVESDPETGEFIIDGKRYEELSEENDETLKMYNEQYREKRDAFMDTLNKYIDEKIKLAITRNKK